MFGFSFGELLVISLVTLVAVGPQKLPGMLKTMGQWARKLRKMTMDVRQQTGIDEMLRAEGIQLAELRSLMRGYHPPAPVAAPTPAAPQPVSSSRYEDPYGGLEPDPTREYPLEGADAYGALPDDLLEPASSTEVAAAPGAPSVEASAPASFDEAPSSEASSVAEASTAEASTAEAASAEPPAELPVEAPPLLASAVAPPAAPVPAAAEPPPASPPAPALAAVASAKPPPPPVRSVPPPPRPSTAPAPPRRTSAPPRPESSAPPNKPEAAPAAAPSRPVNGNGNG